MHENNVLSLEKGNDLAILARLLQSNHCDAVRFVVIGNAARPMSLIFDRSIFGKLFPNRNENTINSHTIILTWVSSYCSKPIDLLSSVSDRRQPPTKARRQSHELAMRFRWWPPSYRQLRAWLINRNAMRFR